MCLEERTDADVRRCIGRLRAEYGAFDVEETVVENDPEFFEHGRELAMEGWRGDAAAWITDAAGRVLLIRHAAEPDRWAIPGGGHEPGETHAETARREVREETGVECELTDVFRATRTEIVHETDRERRLHVLTVNFEGRAESHAIDSSDDEILDARWFAEPPAEGVVAFLDDQVTLWVDEN